MIIEIIDSWTTQEKIEAFNYLSKKNTIKFEKQPTQMEIIDAVCLARFLTLEQITAKNRVRPISEARHIVFYFCKYYNLPLTLVQIGAIFKADHATVCYGVLKIKNLIDVDSRLANEINSIANALN